MDKKLIADLKKAVKGKILVREKLSMHTSFRIGGPADIWVEPSDTKELKKIILFASERNVSLFVIGTGSNVLVNDSGVEGIVIHLGASSFRSIKIKGNNVTVGAGYSMSALVRLCCEKGLAGMESMTGIPGTVGGAIHMNAGGSTNPIFKNIGDFVTSVKVMEPNGSIKRLKREDIQFGYRCSSLHSYIIIEATLKLEKGDKAILNSSRIKFLDMKKQKQALDAYSAGCVFKNPENFQFTCGQMIDMLGLKGASVGGAEVSGKHANFIINKKDASCRDVIELIKFIKTKVKDNYNIDLELEIKVI
ncbi:MAG: UDP-N-acetylmuramate dehydrogenase [Candidatus Omnitrophota bacterium]|jgi:UDP-N-acetylmuramate dehydrogenase